MAIPIPSPLVEFILLGPLDDRRQLQDSPILGDVWVEYGKQPDARLDLLIVPYRAEHPGAVAGIIDDALAPKRVETKEEPRPTWEEIARHVDKPAASDENPKVAYLQGLVVARLKFRDVLSIVVPKTNWWISRWPKPEDIKEKKEIFGDKSATAITPNNPSTAEIKLEHEVEKFDFHMFEGVTQRMLDQAKAWHEKRVPDDLKPFQSIERFLVLMGIILWASVPERPEDFTSRPDGQIDYILKHADSGGIAKLLVELTETMIADKTREPLVWQVSLNRRALPALSKSVPAVKADAAKTLFNVDCSDIGWAVIDSGIDGNHPAFMKDQKSRVKGSFDFKNFRRVVSLSNSKSDIRKQNLIILLHQEGLLLTQPIREAQEHLRKADAAVKEAAAEREAAASKEADAINARDAIQAAPGSKEADAVTVATANTQAAAEREAAASKEADAIKQAAATEEAEIIKKADEALYKLAMDARNKGPVHWELVAGFVEIGPGTRTQTNHGTHVAGIIGACKTSATEDAEAKKEKAPTYLADGMCPDISLYDFRVLGRDITETEFAIIAALQFIRYLNDRDNLFTIHGANLSLSIPHDVRNFACGRTPICDECERLIASGVVVVAAAGNHGYKSFQTADGSYDSYAAFSITDPGNAENVLTVGATHRFWPHTYGVSFFSSRGPTGDGRLKPDLVAPGERIRSTFPGNEWGDLDGTSMAAPHVSGAAAMLLARYSELIGQPLRVKRILCDSATDLGRERSFQGRGMLDVLRSFQSI